VHRGGLVDPGVEGGHVALAGSIALQLAAQGGAVGGRSTGVQRVLGVDRAIPAAHTRAVGALLDDEEIKALLRGISAGSQAAVAAADNQEVGGQGLGDVALGNLRGFTQPVGRAGFLGVVANDLDRNLTLGLLDALVGTACR